MRNIVNQDGHAYRTHKEVLNALGIDYPGKGHREGSYALFDGWRIWFPNMTGQGGDWLNRFFEGERVIEETYVGKGEPNGGRVIFGSETRLIVFPKFKNGYEFRGVFEVERANARIRRYRKLAESCELRFDARLA